SCTPASVPQGKNNTDVIVTATSSSGSGFFDPGPAFVSRISASISGNGVTINNLSYTDPTHLSLNITVASTASLGARTVTVTNPDGQSATSSSGILTIDPGADLGVTEAGSPNPVVAGYNLIYSLAVTNSGASAATGVVLRNTLSSEVSLVSAS